MKKNLLKYICQFVCLLLVASCQQQEPLKVGILHSLTGHMADSEAPMVDIYRYAIEEINATGGIHGRLLQPIILDGASDNKKFAQLAVELYDDYQVEVIFGCWTSACRKSVLPVVEMRRALFVYPVQYEGLENSGNILYAGAAPNQQIIPAINWLLRQNKKRFFLIGSDYVFPRVASRIVSDIIKFSGAKKVGELFAPFNTNDFSREVAAIARARPDVIINTINGNDNLTFFRALRQAGIFPEQIPVLSFSLTEVETRKYNLQRYPGDYAA